MTREEVFENLNKIYRNNKNVILQWATGVGKTKAAIEKIHSLEIHSTILIVVAERSHIQNWKDEFNKWDKSISSNYNITILCYPSIRKMVDIPLDLVILDEAHHINTDIKLDSLKSLKFKSVLALSATLSKDCIDKLSYVCGEFYNYKISTKEAIDNNILAEPKIYLHELYLNSRLRTEVIEDHRGNKDRYKIIRCNYEDRWKYLKDKRNYPNIKLIMAATPLQKYNYYCDKVDFYKRKYMSTRNQVFHNCWMRAGSDRKMFMGSIKTEAVRSLTKSDLKDTRYICFCTNIEQAESLNKNNCIHSKINKPEEVLNRFNQKKISSIYAVQMLTEGTNLTDIKTAIIVQLDSKDLKFIQKVGRALRSKEPDIHIFYFKNTRDEEYLKMALENIDSKYIVK